MLGRELLKRSSMGWIGAGALLGALIPALSGGLSRLYGWRNTVDPRTGFRGTAREVGEQGIRDIHDNARSPALLGPYVDQYKSTGGGAFLGGAADSPYLIGGLAGATAGGIGSLLFGRDDE